MPHKLFSSVNHMTGNGLTENICRLAARASILSIVRSAIASSRSHCGTMISFLEVASHDETPIRPTDDALDLKHVLQEVAETSCAFAVAVYRLVSSREEFVCERGPGWLHASVMCVECQQCSRGGWCHACPTFRATIRAISSSGAARLSYCAAPARWQ